MSARLAYILSASHSGSTLLAMLLGAHPDACTVGELQATNFGDPDLYRCSCGEGIRRCLFWRRVGVAMQERGFPDFEIARAGTSFHEFDHRLARRLLRPLCRGPRFEQMRDLFLSLVPGWRAHVREAQQRNLALIESLHALTGARWVVDSSKLALRLKYVLRIPSLEVKVIRVVRDGRAVALSYTDEWQFADAADPQQRGGGSGVRRPTAARDLAEAVREWRRSNESADCLTAQLPESAWIQVRYEDLCANPRETLGRLCQFLGLDPGRIQMDFKSVPHHVVGNGMRFDRSSQIRLDERWKTHLTPAGVRAFTEAAGHLNRRYGYV